MTDSKKQRSDDLIAEAQAPQGYNPNGTPKQVVPEGYTSLGAPYEIDDYIQKNIKWMAGHKDLGGHSVPRFGLMSLMCTTTPVVPYDNPVMNKICRTAFTDGIRTYMHTSLVQKIWDEDVASGGTVRGIIPLNMHESIHKLRRHVDVHAHLDPVDRNKAQDYNINATIIESFPEMEWPVCLREMGLGFGPGESAKYFNRSEISIYFELRQERRKALEKAKPPGGSGGQNDPDGGGDSGQGQGGQGNQKKKPQREGPGNDPGQGGGSSDQGQGQKQKGRPGPGQPGGGDGEEEEASDQFGADGDQHTIDPRELIRRLEEAGMDETMRRLNMPSSKDEEGIQTLKDLADMGRIEAINKAARQMKDAEEKGYKYPGAAMVHGALDTLTTQAKPKMTYKMQMREAFLQSGTKQVFVEDDEPDDIYYVDKVTKMLGGRPLYHGVHIDVKPESAVIVVFDASGSVTNENFKEGLAEVWAMKRCANNFGDTATKVIVVMGDTELADGFVELNEENWEQVIKEGVQRKCMGGTNMIKVLNQTLHHETVKGLKIQSVVMFTDSFVEPPPRESIDLSGDPFILFAIFSTTGTGDVEKWAKATSNYARTVRVDEGVEVDLSETYMDSMEASPVQQQQRKRRRSP